jgi:hypothetical protein
MRRVLSRSIHAALALALLATGNTAAAQFQRTVTVTVDENGVGRFQTNSGLDMAIPGFLMEDPGPGGLASALTYFLQNPPGLVAGDLLLESPGGTLRELIRFNDITDMDGNSGELLFYSAMVGSTRTLADVGFPTARYANTLTRLLPGPGPTDFVYTPAAGQPGFIQGITGPTTYVIQIRPAVVPEPSTAVLVLTGVLGVAVAVRRKRPNA